jgi:hypothetical protein
MNKTDELLKSEVRPLIFGKRLRVC